MRRVLLSDGKVAKHCRPPEGRLHEQAKGGIRHALGEAGVVAAWEAGRHLSLDEAIAEALALTESTKGGPALETL